MTRLIPFTLAFICAAGPAGAQSPTPKPASAEAMAAAAREAAEQARAIAAEVSVLDVHRLTVDAMTMAGEVAALRAGVAPMAAEAAALAHQVRARHAAGLQGARAGSDRESRLYSEGRAAIDRAEWDRAIERYTQIAELKGDRADAALYWKAFAQDRQGLRTEALATLASLGRDYPKSRYLQQAKVLEAEIRQNAGQPARPQDQADEDLKLMAINGLQHTAPEQAVPMLDKLLRGPASPKLKERALFVLAQSDSAQAREVLAGIARGSSLPDLQSRAIVYLGQHGGTESRALLSEVYGSTTDVSVKRNILRAFMVAGEKGRLVTAAQSEQNPELRTEAIRQLGVMNAHEELWQLYQREASVDQKRQIIRAMFVGGNATRMTELARGEQNPELRREAIRNLGLMGSKGTADALAAIYAAERDPEVKKAVIGALALNDNAEPLIALARKEQDTAMRTEIVRRLSTMASHSKAAADYMIEILGGK